MEQTVYFRRMGAPPPDKVPEKVHKAGPDALSMLAQLEERFDWIPALTAAEPSFGLRTAKMEAGVQGAGIERALGGTHYAEYISTGSEPGAACFSFLSDPDFPGRDNSTLHVQDDGRYMRFLHGEFAMRVDMRSAAAQVIIKDPDFVMVDQVLRIGFHVLSRLYGCFFVHACGIGFEGKGILFPAASDTGKTTIANASKRYQVLNDDTMLVDCNEPEPMIWGPPFAGRGGNSILHNAGQKLEALIFPVQAPHDRLNELMPAQAMAKLSRNVMMQGLNYQMTPGFLGMLEKVIKQVRAYEMEFTKSDNFVGLLEQLD